MEKHQEPDGEFLAALGAQIRTLRKHKGLSLQELAKLAGLSTAFLSLLERGRKTCSLMTLHRIGRALNVPVRSFFEALDEPDEARGVVVRRDQRRQVPLHGIRQKLYLLTAGEDAPFHAILNVLPAGVSTADHGARHEGYEWMYVLQGTVVLYLDGKRYVLERGDAAGFDSNLEHRITNSSDEDAEILWVNYPPQF